MNAVIIKCKRCREDYIVLPIANRNYYCPYCRDFRGIMVAEIATGKYTIIHKTEVKKRRTCRKETTDYPFDPNVIEMGQL